MYNAEYRIKGEKATFKIPFVNLLDAYAHYKYMQNNIDGEFVVLDEPITCRWSWFTVTTEKYEEIKKEYEIPQPNSQTGNENAN